jgi:putative sterol carrier protein
MTVAESFEAMLTVFNPTAAAGMNKTFQWNITGAEAGFYALKITNGTCELIKDKVDTPNLTFTVSDQDWIAIASGKLDPMAAFGGGKVKANGDLMLAMKLQNLFPFGK